MPAAGDAEARAPEGPHPGTWPGRERRLNCLSGRPLRRYGAVVRKHLLGLREQGVMPPGDVAQDHLLQRRQVGGEVILAVQQPLRAGQIPTQRAQLGPRQVGQSGQQAELVPPSAERRLQILVVDDGAGCVARQFLHHVQEVRNLRQGEAMPRRRRTHNRLGLENTRRDADEEGLVVRRQRQLGIPVVVARRGAAGEQAPALICRIIGIHRGQVPAVALLVVGVERVRHDAALGDNGGDAQLDIRGQHGQIAVAVDLDAAEAGARHQWPRGGDEPVVSPVVLGVDPGGAVAVVGEGDQGVLIADPGILAEWGALGKEPRLVVFQPILGAIDVDLRQGRVVHDGDELPLADLEEAGRSTGAPAGLPRLDLGAAVIVDLPGDRGRTVRLHVESIHLVVGLLIHGVQVDRVGFGDLLEPAVRLRGAVAVAVRVIHVQPAYAVREAGCGGDGSDATARGGKPDVSVLRRHQRVEVSDQERVQRSARAGNVDRPDIPPQVDIADVGVLPGEDADEAVRHAQHHVLVGVQIEVSDAAEGLDRVGEGAAVGGLIAAIGQQVAIRAQGDDVSNEGPG
jgi:hypothetical protein